MKKVFKQPLIYIGILLLIVGIALGVFGAIGYRRPSVVNRFISAIEKRDYDKFVSCLATFEGETYDEVGPEAFDFLKDADGDMNEIIEMYGNYNAKYAKIEVIARSVLPKGKYEVVDFLTFSIQEPGEDPVVFRVGYRLVKIDGKEYIQLL